MGEGHVDALRVYGPDGNTAIVTLKASAPGGARQCKVSTKGQANMAMFAVAQGAGLTCWSDKGLLRCMPPLCSVPPPSCVDAPQRSLCPVLHLVCYTLFGMDHIQTHACCGHSLHVVCPVVCLL